MRSFVLLGAAALCAAAGRGGGGAVTDAIPAKYNTKSDLTFDVPSGGPDKADFALTK